MPLFPCASFRENGCPGVEACLSIHVANERLASHTVVPTWTVSLSCRILRGCSKRVRSTVFSLENHITIGLETGACGIMSGDWGLGKGGW